MKRALGLFGILLLLHVQFAAYACPRAHHTPQATQAHGSAHAHADGATTPAPAADPAPHSCTMMITCAAFSTGVLTHATFPPATSALTSGGTRSESYAEPSLNITTPPPRV